ncbi:hypothetical protein ACFQ4C_08180 [Larkinella insperata]|uniref:Uncharacterized protein n=1 Tax=Larkinella insperata TaxID=332158 RepID=A0ABW3Q798_9BACT
MKQLLRFLFIIFLLPVGMVRAVIQEPQSVSGRVLGYLSNRIGDYDGLRLQTTSGEIHLSFPPHAAARIRQLAAIQQRITAGVESVPAGPAPHRPSLGKKGEEGSQMKRINYRLIRLRSGDSGPVFQLADWPPPPPQQGQQVQAEGPLVRKIYDDQGRLSALLTDTYLIELKPHQAEQISALLVGIQQLGVTGFARTVAGFVNQTGRTVLRPTSLTIRGQTFTL